MIGALGRFIFNDEDLGRVLVVEQITRELTPARQVEVIEVPGSLGDRVGIGHAGGKYIKLRCRYIPDLFSDQFRALSYVSGVLQTPTPRRLYLKDRLEVYEEAICTAVSEVRTLKGTAAFEITFFNPSGLYYSEFKTIKQAGRRAEILIGGTAPTWGTLKTKATGTAVTIKTRAADGTESRIKLEGTRRAQAIEVDYYASRVIGLEPLVTFDSSFKPYLAGLTSIELTGAEGLEIRYREAWY